MRCRFTLNLCLFNEHNFSYKPEQNETRSWGGGSECACVTAERYLMFGDAFGSQG